MGSRGVVACLVVAALAAADDTRALLAHVNATGDGFVHPAQDVRELAPGYRGLVAAAPIKAGEVLVRVPWDLVVAAPDTCEVAKDAVERLVTADTPYARHLRAHDPLLPCGWPASVKPAIAELPPRDWDRHETWFERGCLKRAPTADERRAMYLTVARAGGGADPFVVFLAPLYDLYNHRNGAYHNTRVQVLPGDAVVVAARRDVAAGEELYNSYGVGTPGLFRDYAFVEPFPQTWDLVAKHPFELDEGGVSWPRGAPDAEGALEVHQELTRLSRELAKPLPAAATDAETKAVASAAAFRAALVKAVAAARQDLLDRQQADARLRATERPQVVRRADVERGGGDGGEEL